MRQRRLEKAAAEALSGAKTTLEKILTDDEPAAAKQPRMMVGHEYVRWVRRHVVTARRPTPS